MVQSYVVYIGLPLFCWLFAYLAERYDSKKYIWFIILALTMISGLRGYSVGLDTYNYSYKFQLINQGSFEYAYGLEEPFKYICYCILKIYNNNTFILTVFALITNGCIISRFWDFRKLTSFSCMVLCYYASFFFATMNGIRQFCAVAIVFYATRYLTQQKILRFLIGVLIATMFHRSALVGLAFLIVSLLKWKTLSSKQKGFFSCLVLVVPFAFSYMFDVYERYFYNPTVNIGLMIIVKMLFLLFTMLFVFVLQTKYSYLWKLDETNTIDSYNISMICIFYLLGLGMAAMGYVFRHMERISWYFYIFEGAYYGILLKQRNRTNRLIFWLCITFFIGYGFVYSLINNSQGTMPYVFFWQ